MVEDFVAFKLRFGVCAVYLLLEKGKVVYVGKSTNVFARIGNHYQGMKRKQRGLVPYLNNNFRHLTNAPVFDEVRVQACAKAELDAKEIELIQRWLPDSNVLHKRPTPKVDVTQLDGFQRLLRTGRKEPKIKRRKLPPRPVQIVMTKGITLPKLKCLDDRAA